MGAFSRVARVARVASAALVVAIVALAPSPGPAQDASPAGTALGCTAAGYDVLLSNPGADAIAAGREVAWEVRFVRKSGVFVLPEPLEPGGDIFVSGALGSDYLSTPKPCTAVLE